MDYIIPIESFQFLRLETKVASRPSNAVLSLHNHTHLLTYIVVWR